MIRNGLYNTLLGNIFKDLLLDVDDITKRRKMQLKNKNPFTDNLTAAMAMKTVVVT